MEKKIFVEISIKAAVDRIKTFYAINKQVILDFVFKLSTRALWILC